eukprot:SM000082S22813  [mRNA]  locus=s82:52973:56561:- [translate_table: standard]
MEALQAELEAKRAALARDFGGRKFVRRAEITARDLERRRAEEAAELRRKASRDRPAQESAAREDDSAAAAQQAAAKKRRVSTAAAGLAVAGCAGPCLRRCVQGLKQQAWVGQVEEEDRVQAAQERRDDVALPRAEVIRRLRVLKHPATLFGEDELQRLARLKVPAELTRAALSLACCCVLAAHPGDGSEPRKEKAKDKERPEGDQGENLANAEADADGSMVCSNVLLVNHSPRQEITVLKTQLFLASSILEIQLFPSYHETRVDGSAERFHFYH